MKESVRFGVCLFPSQFVSKDSDPRQKYEEIVSAAQLAENCKFDSYWVIDHILTAADRYMHPVLEPLSVLAALAASTRRIRLGTSILILPLRDPLLTAKQLATMDAISGGRLTSGVAAGWAQEEYDASGIPFKTRGKRFNEQLRIIKALWTEDNVSFSGEFFSFSDVTIDPKPIQRPHVPLWIGAENVALNGPFERIARYGDAWLGVTSPKHYAEGLEKICRFARKFGRDPSTIERANFTYTMLDKDEETARRRGLQALAEIHSGPIMPNVEKLLVAGSPEEVAKKVENQIRAGVRYVIFNVVLNDQTLISTLADEVIPRISLDSSVS